MPQGLSVPQVTHALLAASIRGPILIGPRRDQTYGPMTIAAPPMTMVERPHQGPGAPPSTASVGLTDGWDGRFWDAPDAASRYLDEPIQDVLASVALGEGYVPPHIASARSKYCAVKAISPERRILPPFQAGGTSRSPM